jgi:hypothetical protein
MFLAPSGEFFSSNFNGFIYKHQNYNALPEDRNTLINMKDAIMYKNKSYPTVIPL